MLLYFIRHGDPIYDPNCLTPLGKRQAEALARRLALYGLDKIYMSGSNRAMETAAPTLELLKKEGTILDWADEQHAWDEMSVSLPDGGRTWLFYTKEAREILTSREIRRLGDDWHEHPYFKGSDFAKGHLRIRRETRFFLRKLGFDFDEGKGRYKNLHYREDGTSDLKEQRVALFAHHGFGTNFVSSVLDIPYPQICLKTNYAHSTLTIIRFREDEEYVIPEMLTMSNDGHLLADRLPTKYNNELYF